MREVHSFNVRDKYFIHFKVSWICKWLKH